MERRMSALNAIAEVMVSLGQSQHSLIACSNVYRFEKPPLDQ
jgi:hypothetical protein